MQNRKTSESEAGVAVMGTEEVIKKTTYKGHSSLYETKEDKPVKKLSASYTPRHQTQSAATLPTHTNILLLSQQF
jgi:hypothetical protein